MQLIIHGPTSHENQENKSSASNQGPIPHQAHIPKVSHTIALSRQEIKNSRLPPRPTQTSSANGRHKVPLNIE